MITTVTLNPSLDLTLEVETLTIGGVSRASSERIEAAGKGVNVALALHVNGVPARAIAAMAPAAARRYVELLSRPGILEVIAVPGLIRTNVAVVEPHGVVTKVNGPGPHYDVATLASVTQEIGRRIAGSRWMVLSGSLPPGCPDDTYARLVALGRMAGCRVAIDADGEALRRGVDAKPNVIKPNRPELEALTGQSVQTVGDAIDAAADLVARGVGAVLCSLGPDGALLVTEDVTLHAWVPPLLSVDSHVGAGDALLAGYLSCPDEAHAALRAAVAWGTAACRLPGTKMPTADQMRPAEVTLDDMPDRLRTLAPPDVAALTVPPAHTSITGLGG